MNFRTTPVILFVLCLLVTKALYASNGPIAIDANDNTTVTLFFPSTIVKVIAPAPNYSFTHEPNGTLATLKARKGNPSNLTVITNNGNIFSFALNYNENIQNFTYVLSPEQAIGRRGGDAHQHNTDVEKSQKIEEPETIGSGDGNDGSFEAVSDSNPNLTFTDTEMYAPERLEPTAIVTEKPHANTVEEGSFYDMDREGYYQIFCENNYLQRTITKDNVADNAGVDLRINHFAVDHDDIYFTLQLRNISKSDYKIGGVQFYTKAKGSEALPIAPEFTFNLGELVKQSGVNKFVYVFKDFNLGPDQKVYVVLDEKEGVRKITLPLDVQALKSELD